MLASLYIEQNIIKVVTEKDSVYSDNIIRFRVTGQYNSWS